MKIRFSIANIIEAIRLVRVNSKAKFDETIDLQLRLNVDPKHGDQMVRGNVLMPGGLGKKFILAVFAPEAQTDQILEAGADIVGQALLLQQLKEGTYKFDKLIATNEVMNLLKPFARQLGPQGLMPNLKAGTLVTSEQLLASVKATKAGSIEFRVDQGKNLMVPLGKVSFEEQRIFQNIEAFSTALMDKRPASIKGSLIKSALVKTTMGAPVLVDPATLDVKSKDYALRGLV